MNHNTTLTAVLWYVATGAQPLLFFLCLWRGIHRKLPWFLAYLGIEFGASCFLLTIHDYREYVACFYLLALASACSKVGIIRNIVQRVFAPYGSLPPGTMRKLVTFCMVAVSVSSALVFRSKATNLDNSMNFLRTADSALTAGTVMGFWLVVIYARKLGLYWRSQVAGIATGFLLFLSVQTATKWVLLGVSGHVAIAVRSVGQFSYVLALLVWLYFIFAKEIPPPLPDPACLRALPEIIDFSQFTLNGIKQHVAKRHTAAARRLGARSSH